MAITSHERVGNATALNETPLWRGEGTRERHHVSVRQLVQDFAKYLYLPRLAEPSALLEAIRSGAELLTWEHDTFAFEKG